MVSFNSSQSKGLSENLKSLQSPSSWPRLNFWASPAILWDWGEHSLYLLTAEITKLSFVALLTSKQTLNMAVHSLPQQQFGGNLLTWIWQTWTFPSTAVAALADYRHYLVVIRGRVRAMWGLLLLSVILGDASWGKSAKVLPLCLAVLPERWNNWVWGWCNPS